MRPKPSRRREAVAIRTCIGCRRRRSQQELLRFVRFDDGSIVSGRTLPGRGAWLCADTLDECRALAEHRKAYVRAFAGRKYR